VIAGAEKRRDRLRPEKTWFTADGRGFDSRHLHSDPNTNRIGVRSRMGAPDVLVARGYTLSVVRVAGSYGEASVAKRYQTLTASRGRARLRSAPRPANAPRRQPDPHTPDVRVETESSDVAQALVGTGIGLAQISRVALTATEGITHRPLGRPRLHRHVHAVTRADADLTPLVGQLARHARQVSMTSTPQARATLIS
jgi:hypothetical protein